MGGNRKLWEDVEVVAVELDKGIASNYQWIYPNDEVIVADAHEYLIEHYKDFDFIWASPPCPTHSVTNHFLNAQGIIRYPDMALYQEILFLKHFYKGKYCIENVKSYYEPLITPKQIGRHYLWANFPISTIEQPKIDIGRMNGPRQTANKKSAVERNAVNSKLGNHILNCARNIITKQNIHQVDMFND